MRVEQIRLEELNAGRDDAPEGSRIEDKIAVGAKGALHLYLANKYDTQPVYTSVRAGEGMWTTKFVVEDKPGKEWYVSLVSGLVLPEC